MLDARIETVAVVPALTAWLVGCTVMLGGNDTTVSVALELVAVP